MATRASESPSRRPTSASLAWTILLVCPPMLAAINPTWGLWSAIMVVALALFAPSRPAAPAGTIDTFLWIAAIITLLSPHWIPLQEPVALAPSINGAACLLYAFAIRRTLHTGAQAILAGNLFIVFGVGYATYFIQERVAVDATNSVLNRSQVEFANANYTGAVLAFTFALTLWSLRHHRRPLYSRSLLLIAAATQFYAVLLTGSRASVTGCVLALIGLLGFFISRRWSYRATALFLIVAFPLGLIHQASNWFRRLSEPLSGIGTFQRDQAAIQGVSGRDLIWMETRDAFMESPILGWGPDRYRQVQESTHYLAHSWGLEFLASIGILGTAAITIIYFLAYRGGSGSRAPLHAGHAMIIMTSLSLVPNLVLSTHQWTLWAWVAVALMSRAHLLQAQEETPAAESTSSASKVST